MLNTPSQGTIHFNLKNPSQASQNEIDRIHDAQLTRNLLSAYRHNYYISDIDSKKLQDLFHPILVLQEVGTRHLTHSTHVIPRILDDYSKEYHKRLIDKYTKAGLTTIAIGDYEELKTHHSCNFYNSNRDLKRLMDRNLGSTADEIDRICIAMGARSHRCINGSQWCYYPAQVAFLHHSSYDMTLDTVAAIFNNHGLLVMEIAHFSPPEILDGRYGLFNDGTYSVFIEKDKTIISFNDSSINYSHDTKNLQRWAKFTSIDLGCYSLVRETYRTIGYLHFTRITRVHNTLRNPPLKLKTFFNGEWFKAQWNDEKQYWADVFRMYHVDPDQHYMHSELNNKLKDYVLIPSIKHILLNNFLINLNKVKHHLVPRDFATKVVGYGSRAHDDSLKYTELFTYCSAFTRDIYIGKDKIYSKASMSAEVMHDVTLSLFIIVANHRAERTQLIKECFAQLKSEQNAGWFTKSYHKLKTFFHRNKDLVFEENSFLRNLRIKEATLRPWQYRHRARPLKEELALIKKGLPKGYFFSLTDAAIPKVPLRSPAIPAWKAPVKYRKRTYFGESDTSSSSDESDSDELSDTEKPTIDLTKKPTTNAFEEEIDSNDDDEEVQNHHRNLPNPTAPGRDTAERAEEGNIDDALFGTNNDPNPTMKPVVDNNNRVRNHAVMSDYVGDYVKLIFKQNILYVNCANHNLTDGAGQAKAFKALLKSYGLRDYRQDVYKLANCEFADQNVAFYKLILNGYVLNFCLAVAVDLNDAQKKINDAHDVLVNIIGRINQYSKQNNLIAHLPLIGTQLFRNPIGCFVSAYRSCNPTNISLCFLNIEEQTMYYNSLACKCFVAPYVNYAIPMDINPYFGGVYDHTKCGFSAANLALLNNPRAPNNETNDVVLNNATGDFILPELPHNPVVSTNTNPTLTETVIEEEVVQEREFLSLDNIPDKRKEFKLKMRELAYEAMVRFKSKENRSLLINDTETVLEEKPPIKPTNTNVLVEEPVVKPEDAPRPQVVDKPDIMKEFGKSYLRRDVGININTADSDVEKYEAEINRKRIREADGTLHSIRDMQRIFTRLCDAVRKLPFEQTKDCAIAHHNSRFPSFKYDETSINVLANYFGFDKRICIVPRKNLNIRHKNFGYYRPKEFRNVFSPNNCLIEAIYLSAGINMPISEYYALLAYNLNMDGLTIDQIDDYLIRGNLESQAYENVSRILSNLGIYYNCINLNDVIIHGIKYPKGGIYMKNHSGKIPNAPIIYWTGTPDGRQGHFFYQTHLKGSAKDKFAPLFMRIAARNVPRRTFVELSCAPGAALKIISGMEYFKDTKFIGYHYEKGLPLDKDIPANISIIPYKTYSEIQKKGDIVFCDAATKQNSEMFIKDLIPIAIRNTVVGGTTVIKTFGNPFTLYELVNHYDDYEIVLREGTLERYFILYNKHNAQDGKLTFDKVYDETFLRETFHSMNISSSRIQEFYKYHFRDITTGQNKVIPADKIKDCLVKFNAITGHASAAKTSSVQKSYPQALWCAHSTVMKNKHVGAGSNSYTEHSILNKLDRKIEQTLVIDECSCFCLEFVALLQLSFPKLKILIIGDIYQTPKVAYDSDYKFMPFTECGVVNNLIDVFAIPQDICRFINTKYGYHMRSKSKVEKGLYYAPVVTNKMKTYPWIAFNRKDVDRLRDTDGLNAHTITTYQGSRESDVVFYLSSKGVHDLKDKTEWVYTAITRATSKLYLTGDENFIKSYFNIHGTMINIYNEESQILLNDDTVIEPLKDLPMTAATNVATEDVPVDVAVDILRDVTHTTDYNAADWQGPYLNPKLDSGKLRTPLENFICNDKTKKVHVFSKFDLFTKHQMASVPINNVATLTGRYSKQMPKMGPKEAEKLARQLIGSYAKLLYGNDHSVHKLKRDLKLSPEEKTHHLKEYIKSYSEKFPAQAKDIDFKDIMDFTQEELSFMAKQQEKFSSDPGFDASEKVLQGVAAFSKKINIHLCAYARAWNHKLHEIIKKEKRPIILKTLGSDEEFAANYAEHWRNCPEGMLEKFLKWLCIDVGEWDASFNDVMIRFSRIIQKWLGIPAELINFFFLFRSHWIMVYRNAFGVTTLEGEGKQFSGNPFTLIENTSLNMAITALILVLVNVILYLFVGDDSAFLTEHYTFSKEGQDFLNYSRHVLKIHFDTVGEFAGFLLMQDMVFPDVWRRAAKLLGKAYRDQKHFDEAIISTKAVMATCKTTYQISSCCFATQKHYENRIDYNQAWFLFNFLNSCEKHKFRDLSEIELMVKNFHT